VYFPSPKGIESRSGIEPVCADATLTVCGGFGGIFRDGPAGLRGGKGDC
jgi:hypothetical protein